MFGNSLPQPIVEHEILTDKFTFKIILFDLFSIVYYAAFKMENIIKTIVKHISAGFFATYAPGTIHNNVFIFFILEHVNSHWQLLPESIAGNFYRVYKMSHFIFIMVAHIDDNGIFILH